MDHKPFLVFPIIPLAISAITSIDIAVAGGGGDDPGRRFTPHKFFDTRYSRLAQLLIAIFVVRNFLSHWAFLRIIGPSILGFTEAYFQDNAKKLYLLN